MHREECNVLLSITDVLLGFTVVCCMLYCMYWIVLTLYLVAQDKFLHGDMNKLNWIEQEPGGLDSLSNGFRPLSMAPDNPIWCSNSQQETRGLDPLISGFRPLSMAPDNPIWCPNSRKEPRCLDYLSGGLRPLSMAPNRQKEPRGLDSLPNGFKTLSLPPNTPNHK